MSKIIAVLFVFLGITSFAQSVNFEGEVHFVTTYTYFPPELEKFKDYLPVTMDIYVRNNLMTKEGPTGYANGYQIHIRNFATNQGYTAMKVGDDAVAYRKSAKDYQTESAGMPTPTSIEYVEGTRKIAGFVCNKALVFLPGYTQPFTVYYTEKIPKEAFQVYKGLKGFPMYFEGDLKGVKYYSEAKSANPTPQSDSRFLLPKEYTVVSYEEFKSTLMKDVE